MISTHILDTRVGKPAKHVDVELYVKSTAKEDWSLVASHKTNEDGRIADFAAQRSPGLYKLVFRTADYFQGAGIEGFYPQVDICFEIKDVEQHYHVPLLLNPFGYSTYRGS